MRVTLSWFSAAVPPSPPPTPLLLPVCLSVCVYASVPLSVLLSLSLLICLSVSLSHSTLSPISLSLFASVACGQFGLDSRRSLIMTVTCRILNISCPHPPLPLLCPSSLPLSLYLTLSAFRSLHFHCPKSLNTCACSMCDV